jgi:hypothetical protein
MTSGQKYLYLRTQAYRWARMLKQQSPITVYCLPTKENKLSFSVSVLAKKKKALCFPFPFAENKQKVDVFR